MGAKAQGSGLVNPTNGKTHKAHALVLQRRAQVASLILNHVPNHEIARLIGVSQSTISYDIRALQIQWYNEATKDITEHKARVLAELDAIISECTTHLHAKDRDKTFDSVWITQWRTTLLEKAKIIGMMQQQQGDPLLAGARVVGVREVILELPPSSVKQIGPPSDG